MTISVRRVWMDGPIIVVLLAASHITYVSGEERWGEEGRGERGGRDKKVKERGKGAERGKGGREGKGERIGRGRERRSRE